MKKIFFLAATLIAAVSANAASPAVTWDFAGLTSENSWAITKGTLNVSETSDKKFVYDAAADTELTCVPTAVTEQVTFSYTSVGKEKAKAFVVSTDGYVEFGGKGGIVIISGLQSGDVIVLHCAAKGSSVGNLTATDGCAGDDVALPAKGVGTEGADEKGYVWKDATFTASASTATITENGGGARFTSISINQTSGIFSPKSAVKSEKVIENGQLYIIRNGEKYNVLGAKVSK